jgi:hypothetical protein
MAMAYESPASVTVFKISEGICRTESMMWTIPPLTR